MFEDYGGDLGEPTIDADAESVEEMMVDARLVSNALAKSGIKHRLEVYGEGETLRGYLHHRWPNSTDEGE